MLSAVDTNTVIVASETADPDPSNNTSSADVDSDSVADLCVDQERTGDAGAGEPRSLHDRPSTMQGPSAAVNPVVTDVFPVGVLPLSV